MAAHTTTTWTFTIMTEPAPNSGVAVRCPMAGLYIDDVRDTVLVGSLQLINCIPEDDETGVPADGVLRLQIVNVADATLDPTVKVYLTPSSTGIRTLIFDQAAGCFQAGWDGPRSDASWHSSPSATALDELWLVVDKIGNFSSLESILIEVEGSAGAATLDASYNFTIEDLSAPTITEILWLTPRKCRVKFSELMNTSTTPGGTLFLVNMKGNIAIPSVADVSTQNKINTFGAIPDATWIGYIAQIGESAYVVNNRPRAVTGISASTKRVTVDVSDGILLLEDAGIDANDAGLTIRERNLMLSLSSYYLVARLSAEGIGTDLHSEDRIQCAYCPMPIAVSLPLAAELPVGEDPTQYVYIEWDQDISYGRLYTLHAVRIQDQYGNETLAGVDATLNFMAPWFAGDERRMGFWSDGLVAGTDKQEDLENDGHMRRIAVVLQDTQNMLLNRSDLMQYLHDPSLCPDEWVDHLLYNLGNPFRFPLTTMNMKRRLAAALSPGFYKKVGTKQAIIDMIYALLGITVTIDAFVETSGWVLGVSLLGETTYLNPSSTFAKNCYEITSPIALTVEQRRIITDVAEWADGSTLHLLRIVEP